MGFTRHDPLSSSRADWGSDLDSEFVDAGCSKSISTVEQFIEGRGNVMEATIWPVTEKRLFFRLRYEEDE